VVSYRKDTKLRKTYDKAFKTKVVLEALKEELTLQELGQKYDVHPNQIGQWKKQALEAMPDIFERPNKKSASERESEDREEQMLKTIGTQKIEIDWLKKAPAYQSYKISRTTCGRSLL
jgi:transposase